MSNPNLLTTSGVYGTTQVAILNTVTANIVTISSNSIAKLNTVILSNYTSVDATANVMINRSSTQYYLAGTVTVPANKTIVVSNRDSLVYLNEGDVLQANTSSNSSISMTASYELLS